MEYAKSARLGIGKKKRKKRELEFWIEYFPFEFFLVGNQNWKDIPRQITWKIAYNQPSNSNDLLRSTKIVTKSQLSIFGIDFTLINDVFSSRGSQIITKSLQNKKTSLNPYKMEQTKTLNFTKANNQCILNDLQEWLEQLNIENKI